MTCLLCDKPVRARGLCSAHYQSETTAGRLENYPKVERPRMEKAVNGRCPDHHKHGETHTCYTSHGCRCYRCRKAKALRRQRYDLLTRQALGRDVWVPARGTVRRLRALAVIGWSVEEIATRAGLHPRALGKVREGTRARVHSSTWRAVKAVYERVENTPRVSREGRITRTYALRQGWYPPAMWDDPDRDRKRSPHLLKEAS